MYGRQKCWLPLLLSGIFFSFSCAHRRITASTPTPSSPLARTFADSGHDENETVKRPAPWDPPDDPRARRAWFRARKRSAANLHQLHALLGTALPAAAAASLSTNPFQWTFIGPQPIVDPYSIVDPYAGSVLTLALDPHNSCVVYAGTFVGKLWKTNDCGNTWQPLSDAGPLVQIQSISVDPVLTNTLYVLDAGSIYKSADGGVTWTELPPVVSGSGLNCFGDAFAIHPTITGTWLIAEGCYSPKAGSYAAIYRSTDGGSTWTQVQGPSAALSFYQIGFNSSNGSFAYASGVTETSGDAQYSAVFQTSSDSGVTWTSALGSGSASLPSGSGYALVLFGAAPSAPKTVYLLVESVVSGTVVLKLFKTVDQGTTWTALTGFPSDNQFPRPPGLIAINPTNPNTVFAGALALYGSTDGGQTWQPAYGTAPGVQLHVDNHAMIFSSDGTRLYESNDGGVWTMQPASSTAWVNLNTGFGTAEFYPGIGIDPTNIARAFGGTQDNGTLLYGGSLGWTQAGVCGDGFAAAINTTSPNIVYASCNGGFFKSVSGGALGSWTQAQSGLPATITEYPVFTMDAASPNVLYAYALPQTGTGQTIFQSLDGAASWHQVGPTFQYAVAAVAVAPSDSNTVVAADDEGNISVTTNALSGSTSTWVSHGPPSTPTFVITYVTGITIDPKNPNRFYLICQDGTENGLFESVDGAVTWQSKSLVNVTGSLTGLVVDPDLPNTLYLSTDSSVFRSSDGEASWYPLASGFPFVNVSSITLHHASRTLRAGTIGRGAWDLAVPTTAPRVGSVSVAQAVPGDVLTVNGVNFVSNSLVQMNGSPLASNFISGTQLTATVPPGSSLNASGNLIAVYNPGNAGGLSDPVSVVIPPFPAAPSAPILVSPANGAAGVSPTPSLSWNASSGAISYNVYLGTSSTPPLATNTTATSYGLGPLNSGTTYYWQVVAEGNGGATGSAIWSFTTQGPMTIGTTDFISKFIGLGSLGNSAVYETNGFVGIGTMQPGISLDVRTGALPQMGIAGVTDYLTFFASDVYGPAIYWDPMKDMRFGKGGSGLYNPYGFVEQMSIQSSTGNVGIGTMTPGFKLDVAGDVNFTGSVRYQGIPVAQLPGGLANANVALGLGALPNVTTGINNIAIGHLAASLVPGTNSNNIHIGNQGSASDSGTIRIGTPGTQSFFFAGGVSSVTTGNNNAIGVLIDSAGQLGTASSSRRFKEDIHDMGALSQGLLSLQPVLFRYKQPFADGAKPIQYGLIAEDVAKVFPDLVARSADGQIETVKYQVLGPMLLNGIQFQQAEIRRLKQEVDRQRQENEELEERLVKIEAALGAPSGTKRSSSGQ